jgi:hypothetical protein
MNDFSKNPEPRRNPNAVIVDPVLDQQVEEVARQLAQIEEDTKFNAKAGTFWRDFDPTVVIPFLSDTGECVVPVSTKAMKAYVMSKYEKPSQKRVQACKEFSSKPENYGTAPGECLAFLESILGAFKPRNAFVFGTGTGNIERIIAENSPRTQIVTLDMRTEQLKTAVGAPNPNNLRYRDGLGIKSDKDIGKNFKNDSAISGRIHQLLGNSFAFNPGRLKDSMQFVFVDGGHQLPVALNDLKNALLLIDRSEGGVILVDDFRKKSSLNSGVDGALVNFSNITGLSVIWPQPAPGHDDFGSDVGMIIVPQNFKGLDECIQDLETVIKVFAKQL